MSRARPEGGASSRRGRRSRKERKERQGRKNEGVEAPSPRRFDASALSLDGEATPAETIRRVIETAPGERPLLPEFGCEVHRLARILDASERSLAAALIEESLERFAPWLGVRRVEVLGVRAFAEDDPDAPRGTLRVRYIAARESGEVDVAWYGSPAEEKGSTPATEAQGADGNDAETKR